MMDAFDDIDMRLEMAEVAISIGKHDERAAIVEWIRSGAGPYVEGYGDQIADAIERGEHLATPKEDTPDA